MERKIRLVTTLAVVAGLVLTSWAVASEPRTPEKRLEAIAPLVHAAVSNAPDFDGQLQSRAQEVGVSPERLDLWTQLFMGHGKRGLHYFEKASAVELAQLVQGTWELDHRVVEGVPEEVTAFQYNRIAELRDGYATVDALVLEEGFVAPSLCDGDINCAFALGAFGTVVYEDVTGKEYGLAPGETAVKMSFEGHVSGEGYPGFDSDVRGIISALWVKHGETYRTVNFKHRFEGMSREQPGLPALKHSVEQHMPVFASDAILEVIGNKQSLEYESMEAVETQTRHSESVRIWDLGEYWTMALTDITMMSPAVAARAITPNAARHAAQQHRVFKELTR